MKPKFEFIHKSFILSNKREYQLLQKRKYKLKTLNIPIKGSSNIAEFVIDGILRTNKPELTTFKTLCSLQVGYISEGFLRFFQKNKQALRTLQTFQGKIQSFNPSRAIAFSKFLNNMKNLQQVSDLSQFLINKTRPPKEYRFTFPNLAQLKRPNYKTTTIKPISQNWLVKKVYPFRKVRQAKFSNGVNYRKLYPFLEKLEIDLCNFNSLSEVNLGNLQELRIIDESDEEVEYQDFEHSLEELKNLVSLERLCVQINNRENIKFLNIIEYLPYNQITIYLQFDGSLLASNEEQQHKINNFIERTKSTVRFVSKESNDRFLRSSLEASWGSSNSPINQNLQQRAAKRLYRNLLKPSH